MSTRKNQGENPQRYDLIISGAGIAGLTLACLLGDLGLRIALIEPFPPAALKDTPITGRTVALMKSSLNVLRAAGMGDFIEEHGTTMEVMRILDDSIPNQKMLNVHFDSFDLGQPYFSMNIPNAPLRAALFEHAQSIKTITIHKNSLSNIKALETKVHAELEDGATLIAPLIIGADGRKSIVRESAGIKIARKEYGQSAITCVINHSRAHDFTSIEFHRPSGPFALVPMRGNQSSVVWVEHTKDAEEIMRLPRPAFEQKLQDNTKDILGGITLETNPECWPLCSIKAKSLIAPRVALIAEAAHVMSPITAQGLNLSLRDVAGLSEIIADTIRIGADHGSHTTLRQYESRRNIDIATRIYGVNGMNALVSNNNPVLKDMRRMGLKMIDKFSPLKMLAMQHGLAPSLDQGRLVQGRPL